MFEHGFDQAAGLRGESRSGGAALLPLASPAQPSRGHEWLYMLAGCLANQGRCVVIVDGTANESTGFQRDSGNHLGLLRALQDPSIGHLEHPNDLADWLVMPGARGLQALQETTHAAGAPVALARLLAPFAPGVIVLLYAPAFALAGLLPGLNARAMVPLIDQPQASIDAYGAVKLLHSAGLAPVLAPLAAGGAQALQPLVTSVTDCASRHLGLKLESWPAHTWGHRAQASAITSPADAGPHGYHGLVRGTPTTPLWS
ncbi:MAG: hypothetical protein QUV35_00055 [Hydrogenophaga sp.]|uniref:hypothetical protein n=1 Tax=Hydrogenophaga sp. TaxID=1904254 RepID=UPI00260680FB|nr:hypothetical protein [Hydrogenophaga sp.]MDM7940994.1 hypothetical protein [Hydrogenophaga sp.]